MYKAGDIRARMTVSWPEGIRQGGEVFALTGTHTNVYDRMC